MVAGFGAVQIIVHFDCALTVHFISDGLIPCRENQLKNELLLPLVGDCIPGDKPCPFQPLNGPAQLVDSGRSALDALVRLDIQLFRNRLIGDPPLHSNNAAGVIHERPDAEHIDLTRKHGQPTQRFTLIVIDLEGRHSQNPPAAIDLEDLVRKPTNTELLWKIQALERKLAALTDMTVFMAAHLSEVEPDRASGLALQLRELQQIDEASWAPEFVQLLQRLAQALCNEDIDLDSLK